MQGVIVTEPGGPEKMQIAEVADPSPRADEVLVRVVASGVNRADLLQRQGHYPPPPGASDILGLECSGVVEAVGSEVVGWNPGDEVCALLSGGGYAELVVVPQGQVMPLPIGVPLTLAAGIPEVAATVVSNLSAVAHLQAGEWVLLHGGGSGIGTFAIQWAKAIGAHVITTVGSERKAALCRELGADVVINYRESDFVAEVRDTTKGHGVDVILDIIGAKYLDANLRALATGGRLVIIGLQGGVRAEIDLARLLATRATVTATSLRARPTSEKADICADLVANVWPMIADGLIRPVVDEVVPLARVAEAHLALASGRSLGKVLLSVSEER